MRLDNGHLILWFVNIYFVYTTFASFKFVPDADECTNTSDLSPCSLGFSEENLTPILTMEIKHSQIITL